MPEPLPAGERTLSLATGSPRKAQCSMRDRYSDRQCPLPAAFRVILGCVHEHMLPGLVCARHITAVRDQRSITCTPCSEGSNAHECRVIGREVTLEEAAFALKEARRMRS